MERKIISLKHARLRKRDAEMDWRNKEERSIEALIENIFRWWGDPERVKNLNISNYPNWENPPEFVRIVKEIKEIGIDEWIREQEEEEWLP